MQHPEIKCSPGLKEHPSGLGAVAESHRAVSPRGQLGLEENGRSEEQA